MDRAEDFITKQTNSLYEWMKVAIGIEGRYTSVSPEAVTSPDAQFARIMAEATKPGEFDFALLKTLGDAIGVLILANEAESFDDDDAVYAIVDQWWKFTNEKEA